MHFTLKGNKVRNRHLISSYGNFCFMVNLMCDSIDLEQDILRTLTDNLPDMLWIKDIKGRYLFANKAICENLLMAKNTSEPIGLTDVFFALRERETQPDNEDWHTFGELCFNSDEVVIENNCPMRFEEYGNVKGKLLYLEVHKAPFHDKNGNILGTVGSARDITEMIEMKRKLVEQKNVLYHQAHHDLLTGLPNRLLFQDRLDQSLLKSKRSELHVALLFIDLDHFKNINDVFGHDRGDQVLQVIAKRIAHVIHDTDTLSRLGGDEFTLIVDNVKDISHIVTLSKRVLQAIEEPVIIEDTQHYVTASIGICSDCNKGITSSDMLKHADSAMYRAKERGRNTFEFYSEELTRKVLDKVLLETELRTALQDQKLDVHFQPKFNLITDQITGMECLIRWQHPDLGELSPKSFIPLAEETGLIVELDRWCYRKSIKQFKLWQDMGLLNNNVLALNLSIKHLEQADLFEFIHQLIIETGIEPGCIELEITETQMMENIKNIKGVLKKIEELGIRLAIDDFGTGYSSLAYLKQLRLDTLKIDRSFIKDLPGNEEGATIVRAILAMARGLKLNVVAEGVENQQQLDFLLNEDCDCAQGYLFSEPLSTKEMEELLLTQQSLTADTNVNASSFITESIDV